jgi:hypothetical protein
MTYWRSSRPYRLGVLAAGVAAAFSLVASGAARAADPAPPTATIKLIADNLDWSNPLAWQDVHGTYRVPNSSDNVDLNAHGVGVSSPVSVNSLVMNGGTVGASAPQAALSIDPSHAVEGGLWATTANIKNYLGLPTTVGGQAYIQNLWLIQYPPYPVSLAVGGPTYVEPGPAVFDDQFNLGQFTFTNNGALSLNGVIRGVGGTVVNNGTLTYAGPAGSSVGPEIDPSVNNYGTFDVKSGEVEIAATTSGVLTNYSGGVIDVESGAILAGLPHSTPDVVLQGGVLTGSGQIGKDNYGTGVENVAGSVRPGGDGTTGILTILSNEVGYKQDAGGELRVDVHGTTPGTNMDQLLVGGPITLGGSLYVDATGYAPAAGVDHEVIKSFDEPAHYFAAVPPTGTFASVTGPSAALFQPIYTPASAPNSVLLRSTGKSGGTGGTGGTGGSGAVTAQQISALLNTEIKPAGGKAKIGAVLKAGGFTYTFRTLTAGHAAIAWYQVPRGAHLASAKTKPKPVLVAKGQLSFTAAGTGKLKVKLTTAGRKLLRKAKHLRLTAKGTFTPTGKPVVMATKAFTLNR